MGLLGRIFGRGGGDSAARRRPGGVGAAEDGDARLAEGLRLHQAGDLQSAERAYRALLEGDPDHGPAHQLLGTLLGASGRLDAALEHLRAAATRAGIDLREPS